MTAMATSEMARRPLEPSSAEGPRSPRRGRRPFKGDVGWDGALVAFISIAYGLAWGIWLLTTRLAEGAGMATEDFLRAIEDGQFSAIESDTPPLALYLITRVQDFSFTIAGLIVISVTEGTDGWRQLGRRLIPWRVPFRWYLLGLIPVCLYGVAALTASRAEGGTIELTRSTTGTILFGLSAGLFVSLFARGAMGEEIGLRGFALPRLQKRTTPTKASLIIGMFWALWHLPILLDREPAAIIVVLLLIIGLSFIHTWLFNGSGGSLIPPLLFHATQNWEEGFETIFPAINGTTGRLPPPWPPSYWPPRPSFL